VLAVLLGLLTIGLGIGTAGAAAPLRLGSVADARFQTGWTLDGGQMAKTREKLLAAANFGAAGTVARSIVITDTAATPGSIDATLLAAFDAFFIGYLDDGDANAFTPGELGALSTWVNGGGVLIVTCDDSGHDAVCAHFGYPASAGAVNPMAPAGEGVGHPIFNGPFGPVAEFQMGGTQGFFTATAGATVLAQDGSGPPRPVFLARSLGAGRVILFADVNIVSERLSDGAAISSNNDKVLGNLFAFAGNVAALRVGSVANARFGTSWTLDGAQMANTRAKLLNPANFGASGTFGRAIRIADTAAAAGSIDAALLDQLDAFFIGYLDDADPSAFTLAELAALSAWVAGGGTLVVTCDDAQHDAVCAHFGHPAEQGAVNPMTPVGEGIRHPIFAGPFGGVPTFQMNGTQGQFTSTGGATILAQDAGGQPIFLVQPVGSGWVILFADVDIIAGALTGGDAITSDDNDRVLGNLFAFAGAPGLRLLASILPISRSVELGELATAYATILVTGLGLATDCAISPASPVPGSGFAFQTTDPFTNQLAGTLNQPVAASGGGARTFLFALAPVAPFGPADVQLQFKCANTAPAPVVPGLNTFLFLATAGPGPDMVALAATHGNTGIVDVAGPNGAGAFAVATINLGAAADITVAADTGSAALPLTFLICRTDAGGSCLGNIQPSLVVPVGEGETPTFAVFVIGGGDVPFDPAAHRVFVRFTVGGVTVGATSVAVRTVPVP
jgi:hypothetical protein